MTSREGAVSEELLDRILELAGTGMILVGGQALAFWSSYYKLPLPRSAVTKDVDLLGTRDDVARLAKGLQGEAIFPQKSSITLLAGQIRLGISADEYVNIDVLMRVYGESTPGSIENRAVTAAIPGGPFRVLHPIDVLRGRLDNTYKLTEKQDEHGLAQLRLGIQVARAFLQDIAAHPVATAQAASRPIVMRHIKRIEAMALSDAGRKVAKRYAIHVADAIDPRVVAHVKGFATTRLPQILKLMSDNRRKYLESMKCEPQ